MANLYSEALCSRAACDQPWDALLAGGKFILFSGAVAATPETAITAAQAKMEITLDEGAWTGETPATATITLTAIGSGNTIQAKVGGIPLHGVFTAASSDTTAEAALLAEAINDSVLNMGIVAVAAVNVVTLYAPFSHGSNFNGVVLTNGGSGGTVALGSPFAGGVDAVNGLTWARDDTDLFKLKIPTGAVWAGTCPAEVTTPVALTHFRYIIDAADDGISDDTVTKQFRRWQGTIGGVGATSANMRMPLSSTLVAAGVKLTGNTITFTIPQS